MQNQFLTEEPAPAYVPFAAPPQTTPETDTLAATVEAQAVTALLIATQHKIRRRKRKFWGSFAAVESAIMLMALLADPDRHSGSMRLLSLLLLLVVGVIAITVMLYTMSRPNEFDTEELRRVGGVRAIGPLLDSLSSGKSSGRRKDLYPTLTLLLLQMQATDADLLTAGRRRWLNRFLVSELWPAWWGPKLSELSVSLAILKAYEQVGDAKAISTVEKLANLEPRTSRQHTIQQAARQCLPLLQSHLGELNTTQTLLRASSPSMAAPDVLLRAAAEVLPVPAGELMRAVEDKSSPD